MKIIDLTFPCVKSFFWVYSSWEPPCWQRRLSRASTSPLLAMLVALPWNRPSFPAPFPWSSSKTLVSTNKTSVHTLFGKRTKTNIWFSYWDPVSVTSLLGPARRNKPGPFSSPTVRKTNVSCSTKNGFNKRPDLQVPGKTIWELTSVFISLAIIFINSLSPSFLWKTISLFKIKNIYAE